MRRYLFNFLAAASLVLAVFVAVLRARAGRRCDYPQFHPGNICFFLHTRATQMRFGYAFWQQSETAPVFKWYTESPSPDQAPSVPNVHFAGVYIDYWHNAPSDPLCMGMTISYWLAILLAAILPAVWLCLRLRRRKRIVEGLCAVCGYDLRATPDRCPECGTVPPPLSSSVSR